MGERIDSDLNRLKCKDEAEKSITEKEVEEQNEGSIVGALEAVLFASGSPVSESRLCEILGVTSEELEIARKTLEQKYRSPNSGISLVFLEGSLQLCTKPIYAKQVKNALELKKLPPLSKAALEVLAIIAYNQPVTRVFIEQVRGIDSSSIVASLCDKGLIREDGTLDAPGRPTLFVTTDAFLRCFGLSSLDDLPHKDDRSGEEGAQLLLKPNLRDLGENNIATPEQDTEAAKAD